MSTSNDFVEYVLELLDPIGDISVSRMFGGTLLKVDGKQLGVIIKDRLYFKVTDQALQAEYKSQGSEQFSYARKDKAEPIIIKNWWSVPAEALDSSDRLVHLAEAILDTQEGD